MQTIASKGAQGMTMDRYAFSSLVGVIGHKQAQGLGLKRWHLRWEQVEESPMEEMGRVRGLELTASLVLL